MIFKFVQVIHIPGIVVQPLVIDTTLKRKQKVILLNKLKFLTGNFHVMLETGAQHPQRKLAYGATRKGIGSSEVVFPALILKSIGPIAFQIDMIIEFRSRPAPEAQP